jgi:hypothetical protein
MPDLVDFVLKHLDEEKGFCVWMEVPHQLSNNVALRTCNGQN